MCHADESRPPAAPVATGAVASAGPLRLTSADGARFAAYQALPDQPTGAGVVVLPDVRDAHEFHRDLARGFAENGVVAVVLDHRGRVAADDGRGPGSGGFAHAAEPDRDPVLLDVAAAVDHLLALGVTDPFTVGFRLGGALSWGQSALEPRLAGAIGFCGRPAECRELIPRMARPVLVLAAGEDVLTPVEDVLAFDRELAEAGVPHEFRLYEGAPHSFFDGALPDQADNAADAWRRVLAFIDEHRREEPTPRWGLPAHAEQPLPHLPTRAGRTGRGERGRSTTGVRTCDSLHAVMLAEHYDFRLHGHVLDLGGRSAAFLAEAAARNPGLTGAFVTTDDFLRAVRGSVPAEVADRISFHEADPLTDPVPGHYDAVLLEHVIHRFDPERNQVVLRAARRVVDPGARLLVLDFLLLADDARRLDPVLAGGHLVVDGTVVYPEDEVHGWLRDTGWRVLETRRLPGSPRVVIAEAA
ncbi:dienelactone hydrolase family protein [Saccharothrix xinjiangensis]|uniref:Dienelactone hydrolase family protein n=1 Tax=Saccharothrix xinjiangensis TaxID=204798 RepID=A0ABV9Y6K7_9PSEU